MESIQRGGSDLDGEESIGLADLLDQLHSNSQINKIDVLLDQERSKFRQDKNLTPEKFKESSRFFEDFDDYSARKSNISCMSGMSRKIVGLDEFEDFDDDNIDNSDDRS